MTRYRAECSCGLAAEAPTRIVGFVTLAVSVAVAITLIAALATLGRVVFGAHDDPEADFVLGLFLVVGVALVVILSWLIGRTVLRSVGWL